MTNVLLLRILQQNASFNGTDPPAPVTNLSTDTAKASLTIFFIGFATVLFVAFTSVLGKQWVAHHTRTSMQGEIVNRGEDRQIKLAGLRKWALHIVVGSLPVMLEIALLFFGAALVVYLWDLDTHAAGLVLVATCVGFLSCILTAVAAAV